MNLKEHYISYIPQVNDAFDQFQWDKEQEFFGVVSFNIAEWSYDDPKGKTYLEAARDAADRMKDAANNTGDENRYREAATTHQNVSIAMFEDYVKYYMSPWREEYKDTPGPICGTTVDMDFIAERGYGWFKFFDKTVTAKLTVGSKIVDYKLIPRYCDKFCKDLEGVFYLDADEAQLCKRLPGNYFEQALKYKKRSVPYKIFITAEDGLSAKPVRTFNSPSAVRDWTLDLFPH